MLTLCDCGLFTWDSAILWCWTLSGKCKTSLCPVGLGNGRLWSGDCIEGIGDCKGPTHPRFMAWCWVLRRQTDVFLGLSESFGLLKTECIPVRMTMQCYRSNRHILKEEAGKRDSSQMASLRRQDLRWACRQAGRTHLISRRGKWYKTMSGWFSLTSCWEMNDEESLY